MIKLSKFIYQKARGDKPKKLKPVCRHRKSALSAGNAVDAGAVSANQVSQTGLRYQETKRQGDECSICQKQKRDARIYRWKLICGLGLADLLSSLDLTIIATATPFISSHFGTSLPSFLPSQTENRTNNQTNRQILGTKLARNSLHPNIHNIHPSLRSISGYIRPPCGAATRHVPHAGWERVMRGCAELGDDATWTCIAGDQFGGNYECYYDCACGWSLLERECG